jgi:hypothetical protein
VIRNSCFLNHHHNQHTCLGGCGGALKKNAIAIFLMYIKDDLKATQWKVIIQWVSLML